MGNFPSWNSETGMAATIDDDAELVGVHGKGPKDHDYAKRGHG